MLNLYNYIFSQDQYSDKIGETYQKEWLKNTLFLFK